MDEADRAQQYEETHRAMALTAVQGALTSGPPLIIDGVRVCHDCEETIPWARLRLGTHIVRCVECQERYERRMRGRG